MTRALLLLALSLFGARASAAEITSNGKGGGDWSNPATWLGQKAPGPEDDAVIQKGDLVDFDRNDDGKISCHKLFIDPRGAFRLKAGLGQVVCCLSGPVEARGIIQLDGTKSASDSLEVRMVGADSKNRGFRLFKGASLLLRGRAELPEGRRNVVLSSPKLANQKDELDTWIEVRTGAVIVDWQRADLLNVVLRADDLDNTGSRSNERVNVVDNRFAGRARIWLSGCDTPVIHKNSFEYRGEKPLENAAAILISQCPLADVRGNTIRGFHYAVQVPHPGDCTIAGNTAEMCTVAFHVGLGHNSSLYQNTARDCERGFDLNTTPMITLEDNRVEGAKIAFRSLNSTVQIAGLQVVNLAKDGIGLLYDATDNRCDGSIILLNCNLRAEQVKFTRQPALAPKAPLPVTAMSYLVVAAKDVPDGATVDVRTVNPMPSLPPGAADLNVRNAPVPLAKGRTPLPRPAGTASDLLPLIVKSWTIDATGKTVAAPEYEVRVLTPDGKAIKSVRVKPQDSWFRAKPDDPTPTVEVR